LCERYGEALVRRSSERTQQRGQWTTAESFRTNPKKNISKRTDLKQGMTGRCRHTTPYRVLHEVWVRKHRSFTAFVYRKESEVKRDGRKYLCSLSANCLAWNWGSDCGTSDHQDMAVICKFGKKAKRHKSDWKIDTYKSRWYLLRIPAVAHRLIMTAIDEARWSSLMAVPTLTNNAATAVAIAIDVIRKYEYVHGEASLLIFNAFYSR